MAASNKVYMPSAVREAYEFAAKATFRPVSAVQELAVRSYLKAHRVPYEFKVVRKKRGPKPKKRAA